MPQKHDNYTRKVLYGIGHGGGAMGGGGEGKSDYKDCFRSQKLNTIVIDNYHVLLKATTLLVKTHHHSHLMVCLCAQNYYHD